MKNQTNQTTKQKSTWKDLFSGKRFRYGAAAAGLTAAVIAVVIVANVLFGVLANHFMWYADMTDRDVYSVSDASVTAIGSVNSRFEIIFCTASDKVDVQDNGMGMYVHQAAKLYDEALDNVSVRYLDAANPSDFTDFTSDGGQTLPTAASVIVAAYPKDSQAGTKPSSHRILSMQTFFTADSATNTVFAFDGEYKFTVTMLGLTGEKPTVYFTDGHGEINGEYTPLYQLFEDAGYSVKVIDLTRDGATLMKEENDGAVLVILDPKKDFGAFKSDRENQDGTTSAGDEIVHVSKFLNDNRGNLMLFMDPIRYDLPNLEELAKTRGIGFKDVDDYVTDTASAINETGKAIAAQYPTKNTNYAYGLLPKNKSVKTIVANACPVYVNAPSAGKITETDTDDYAWNPSGQTHTISPVLTTTATAKAGVEEGQHWLMSLTVTPVYEKGMDGEWSNAEQYSYALISGAPSFLDSIYLNNSYANRDIIYTLMLSIASHGGSMDLMPSDLTTKDLTDETLSITTHQADVWTAICVGILPTAIAICGIVVFVRRKHL